MITSKKEINVVSVVIGIIDKFNIYIDGENFLEKDIIAKIEEKMNERNLKGKIEEKNGKYYVGMLEMRFSITKEKMFVTD